MPGPKPVDHIDQLAADVKASVIETCAKVAEIHKIDMRFDSGPYHAGYNAAVDEIAAKIRELGKKPA